MKQKRRSCLSKPTPSREHKLQVIVLKVGRGKLGFCGSALVVDPGIFISCIPPHLAAKFNKSSHFSFDPVATRTSAILRKASANVAEHLGLIT
jgi:hypothetical protein